MSSARLPVFDKRRAGVLLHLSSLENALGRGGRAFVDWAADAGFTVWQFLPLGPTAADGSPYWVRSDSAGNTAFLDRDELPSTDGHEYREFLEHSKAWLDDYVTFEALSRHFNGAAWWEWPPELRDRDPAAIARVRADLAPEIEQMKRDQFAFAWQWARLREHAHRRGVRLFGDVPFYVAPDSAETWACPGQFQLDATGRAMAVAGVPPDYFSEKGQLWGNPLYDWKAMRKDGFRFWRARISRVLERVDVLRIDHFRALAAHWSVPAGAPDARGGTWKRTPGRMFLTGLRKEYGDLPIVAEDLGLITPDVEALRKDFRLPGMRVLQFAFGGNPQDVHLPHMHTRDCIVYTGTHDNDTSLGWYHSLDHEMRQRMEFYLRASPDCMPDALVRAALGSVGRLAVIPMQDILGLGSEARLNTPGTVERNWTWRLPPGSLTQERARHYAHLNHSFGRGPW
jgi:4-alpha-glucanotransferase